MKDRLKGVVDVYHNNIWHEIVRGMMSYTISGMPERGPFTRALFRLLGEWGYASNPQGSFTANNAPKVLSEEGGVWRSDLAFGYYLTGFFERLENGIVDFKWIWDRFLRDAINEDWFKAKWEPIIGKTDYNILKKGPPATTEARPYVGSVMESNSDNFGDTVHRTVENSLRGMGLKVKVTRR